MVPVNELRDHLESLQKAFEEESTPVKRNAHKADRKDVYRRKLKVA